MATKSTKTKSTANATTVSAKKSSATKKAAGKKSAAGTVDRRSGVAVPLGALYDKNYPVIGEYPALADFSAFCKKAGLKIIQLLPVNDTGTQSSPYSGLSAFALHPIYICISALPEFDAAYKNDKSFAKKYDAFMKSGSASASGASAGSATANGGTPRYDYDAILNTKTDLLRAIFSTTEICEKAKASTELSSWIKKNKWISEYAVFKNLKWKYMQASSKTWKKADVNLSAEEIEKRWKGEAETAASKSSKKSASKTAKAETFSDLQENLFYAWTQMRAAQQFSESVAACRKEGIFIKGDLPILLNEDSCDVWAHPELFNSKLRAGSPPDGENPTGQNWGFPIYDWDAHKKSDYAWWKARLQNAEQYYDAFRLDHVIGFFRIWAVPERDTNAMLGHTEPYTAITSKQLVDAGFDENRIRWLSQPHVPTKIVEDITWNRDVAHKFMAKWLERIDSEELWLFKKEIKGDRDIYETKVPESECSTDAADRIKAALAEKWCDRTLIEVAKNKFVPLWTYDNTTAWKSLNDDERAALKKLFENVNNAREKKWQTQADEIFTALLASTKMIACGEDLGANPTCLPEVLSKHNILGLRVLRWTREWAEEGQPYVPFADYTPLSVVTTSVHDSTTLRGWWEKERESAEAFILSVRSAAHSKEQGDLFDEEKHEYAPFSEKTAEEILKATATSASVWQIHPLIDYLYLTGSYNLAKSDDERINVPGTVTAFNWTWRIPATVSALAKDSVLCRKISAVAKRC